MILGTKTDVVSGMHFGMVSDQFGRSFGLHFGTILGSFWILKLADLCCFGGSFWSGFGLILGAFEDRTLSHFEA